MSGNRKKYTPEYREQAVRLVVDTGRPVAHVAAYVDLRGNATQRRLEPYHLVTTGRRWYLLCFDRDREDWRTLRLDRMSGVRALGTTFAPREAPDAASYVRRSISASPYRYVARVRSAASQEVVRSRSRPHRSTSNRTVTLPASSPPAPTTPRRWFSISRWRAATSRCSSRPRWSTR